MSSQYNIFHLHRLHYLYSIYTLSTISTPNTDSTLSLYYLHYLYCNCILSISLTCRSLQSHVLTLGPRRETTSCPKLFLRQHGRGGRREERRWVSQWTCYFIGTLLPLINTKKDPASTSHPQSRPPNDGKWNGRTVIIFVTDYLINSCITFPSGRAQN